MYHEFTGREFRGESNEEFEARIKAERKSRPLNNEQERDM